MMYRGKQRVDDYRWYYGDLIRIRNDAYIITQSVYRGECYSTKVVPETIKESIDYVDVNGVDVFEGDIIKIRKSDVYSSEQDEEIYVLETKKGFLYRLTKCKYNTIEVIGNKWDNPHLLEMCDREDKTE